MLKGASGNGTVEYIMVLGFYSMSPGSLTFPSLLPISQNDPHSAADMVRCLWKRPNDSELGRVYV